MLDRILVLLRLRSGRRSLPPAGRVANSAHRPARLHAEGRLTAACPPVQRPPCGGRLARAAAPQSAEAVGGHEPQGDQLGQSLLDLCPQAGGAPVDDLLEERRAVAADEFYNRLCGVAHRKRIGGRRLRGPEGCVTAWGAAWIGGRSDGRDPCDRSPVSWPSGGRKVAPRRRARRGTRHRASPARRSARREGRISVSHAPAGASKPSSWPISSVTASGPSISLVRRHPLPAETGSAGNHAAATGSISASQPLDRV